MFLFVIAVVVIIMTAFKVLIMKYIVCLMNLLPFDLYCTFFYFRKIVITPVDCLKIVNT